MNILCYGDSNTWGWVPNINGYSKNATISQYQPEECWWFGLTKENDVIIDGVPGRCVAHENRWLKGRNAMGTIPEDLKQYSDLDFIVLQLGTNDCKTEYGDTAEDIARNIELLSVFMQEETGADVVVISPAEIKENNKITQKYYVGANQKSRELDSCLMKMAEKRGFGFVSGLDCEVGEDGEHLTACGHMQLGEKVCSLFAEMVWFESGL